MPTCDPVLYASNYKACATPPDRVRIHGWLVMSAFVFVLPLGE
jgi:hypothetical protein